MRTTLTWRSASGTLLDLTGHPGTSRNGVAVLPGAQGFDMPPVDLKYDELPGLDGAAFRGARAQSREIFLPLYLWAESREALMALKRGLLAVTNTLDGPGRLTWAEPGKPARFLECYYTGGAEGDESAGQHGTTWCRIALTLRALQPYWLSTETQVHRWHFVETDPSPFFRSPFFRDRLLAKTSLLNGTIRTEISGDVDTYPVWRAIGPMTDLTIGNITTGKAWTYTDAIGVGETLVIDTRPGRQSAISSVNGHVWHQLGEAPELWPVVSGVNELTVEAPGVTEESMIVLEYRPRWLSA